MTLSGAQFRYPWFWLILFCCLVLRTSDTFGGPGANGEEIYRSACAACHGIDGRGVAAHQVGFDTPLPDFTDCSFSSREPDSDWNAISHEGGPVRGFSELMPAFGASLGLGKIEMATAHVRTFCPDKNWPPGELNLPRALVTEKAYPEDELLFVSGISVEGNGAVSNKLFYEKRFGARNQIELILPFGWQERPSPAGTQDWRGGVGDIAVGVKRAFFHSGKTGSILSLAGEVVFPTGDRDKGFGRGTTVFEPFVAFGQILPSQFFFQTQAGVELPVDTDRASREGFWRLVAGRSFTQGRFGRTWSPMVELLGARELVAGKRVEWDIVPQLQVTLSTRQHIMVNVGGRIPLTDSGPRATQLLVYFLWDWFDGGLLSGW